jgi:PadR family transcriptional regulator, regulatory protein PadR
MTKVDQRAPIGEFEQLTLLALLRLEPDAYGASIRREIETRADRTVQLGAVYTTLDRLERKGLVQHWMGEPTAERGGRRKKLYRLTPSGAEALAASVRAVRQLAAGLDRRLAARLGGAQ